MGKSETIDQKAERERACAKAAMLAELLQANNFLEITGILEDYAAGKLEESAAKSKFKFACKDTELVDVEQEWAWNYLKNYDKGLATATDDRWPTSASGAAW